MATLSLEQYQRIVNGNTITLEKLNNKLKTQKSCFEKHVTAIGHFTVFKLNQKNIKIQEMKRKL